MSPTIIKKAGNGVEQIPPGIHVQLSFISGPDRGMVKRLWKKTTILGRSEGDVVLNDPGASKRHASLTYENGELVLRDHDSTNGTTLNGGRVWEAVIGNLDEIGIGETTIQVAILQETASEAAAPEGGENLATDTTRPHPLRNGAAGSEELPAGFKAVLQVVQGPDAGERFEVTKNTTLIGRIGADLSLKDLNVSRKHASIEFMGRDRVLLKDLQSSNGTLQNRRRVSVAPLKNGDEIQVGSTVINFFVSFGSPPKPE